jgi:hypothetical protein
MSTVQKNFTTYVVYYISGSSPAIGIAQDAEIDCFAENGVRAGAIYFYPDSVHLPENLYTVNGIYLHYSLNRFADVMTMLKEEKPLYLYLDTINKSGYIGTNKEPIGEQEGV